MSDLKLYAERKRRALRFKYTRVLDSLDYTALSWEPQSGDIWHTLKTLAELGREPLAFTKVGLGWDRYVVFWSVMTQGSRGRRYATTMYRDGSLTETAPRDYKGAQDEYDEQVTGCSLMDSGLAQVQEVTQ